MATTNLSAYNKENLPDAANMRIGIVVSEWNSEITSNLQKGCTDALSDCGASIDHLHIIHVPGCFELPIAAQLLLENKSCEAVICLGCVIQGETPHFDFVCQTTADGIKDVSLKFGIPVIFGVLTDLNIDQSRARSGGSLGNKGTESAITAIKMISLKRSLEDSW
jgi:6,7-dimethyl-8-ribityllumazine synthase